MENKVFLLIGESESKKLDVIRRWDKLPDQEDFYAIVNSNKATYKRFMLMEDLLFVEGEYDSSLEDWEI